MKMLPENRIWIRFLESHESIKEFIIPCIAVNRFFDERYFVFLSVSFVVSIEL